MEIPGHYAHFIKLAVCALLVGTAIYFRLNVRSKKKVQIGKHTIKLSTVYGLTLIIGLGILLEIVAKSFAVLTSNSLLMDPLIITSFITALLIISLKQ